MSGIVYEKINETEIKEINTREKTISKQSILDDIEEEIKMYENRIANLKAKTIQINDLYK